MPGQFKAALVLVMLNGFTPQIPLFHTGVDLVAIDVTVTDMEGRAVRSLSANAFQVYENGHRRPVVHFASDPQPVSLVIAVDTSFSMRGARFERARSAVSGLVEYLEPIDEVCLFGFSERPFLITDWTKSFEHIPLDLQ